MEGDDPHLAFEGAEVGGLYVERDALAALEGRDDVGNDVIGVGNEATLGVPLRRLGLLVDDSEYGCLTIVSISIPIIGGRSLAGINIVIGRDEKEGTAGGHPVAVRVALDPLALLVNRLLLDQPLEGTLHRLLRGVLVPYLLEQLVLGYGTLAGLGEVQLYDFDSLAELDLTVRAQGNVALFGELDVELARDVIVAADALENADVLLLVPLGSLQGEDDVPLGLELRATPRPAALAGVADVEHTEIVLLGSSLEGRHLVAYVT